MRAGAEIGRANRRALLGGRNRRVTTRRCDQHLQPTRARDAFRIWLDFVVSTRAPHDSATPKLAAARRPFTHRYFVRRSELSNATRPEVLSNLQKRLSEDVRRNSFILDDAVAALREGRSRAPGTRTRATGFSGARPRAMVGHVEFSMQNRTSSL